MFKVLAWIAFGLGAFICCTNFYLSFIRYPLHRLRGLSKEPYRWVSGFPLIGSILVALSLFGLHEVTGMIPVVMVLILVDTGGIHWFVGSMLYQFIHEKRRG